MASRDRIEGDAIEGGTLIVLGILVLLVVVIYSGFKGFKFPDFGALIQKALDAIKNALPSLPDADALIAKLKEAMKKAFGEGPGAYHYGDQYTGKSGPDWVHTGTSSGVGDPVSTTEDGSSANEYQTPDESGAYGAGTALASIAGSVASSFAMDPYAGLPPVELPRI